MKKIEYYYFTIESDSHGEDTIICFSNINNEIIVDLFGARKSELKNLYTQTVPEDLFKKALEELDETDDYLKIPEFTDIWRWSVYV